MTTGTIASRALWPWLVAARSVGLDPAPELQRVGVREAQLRDPGFRLAYSLSQSLIARLVRASGRRDLGLLAASTVEPGHFELLELAARSARNVRLALHQLVRFFALLDDGGALTLERFVGGAAIGYASVCCHAAEPAYVEYLPALLVLAARRETGEPDLCPRQVQFSHGGPADASHYGALFNARVTFDAPATRIDIDDKNLALPLRRANPRTHRGAVAAARNWLARPLDVALVP